MNTDQKRVPQITRLIFWVTPPFSYNLLKIRVYYQEHTAVYSGDPVALIAGYLPQRQQRLVEAWGEIHQQELGNDWESLLAGHVISPIKPLE